MTDHKDDVELIVINQLKKDCNLTEKDEANVKKHIRDLLGMIEMKQIAETQKALMLYQEEFRRKNPKIIIKV